MNADIKYHMNESESSAVAQLSIIQNLLLNAHPSLEQKSTVGFDSTRDQLI